MFWLAFAAEPAPPGNIPGVAIATTAATGGAAPPAAGLAAPASGAAEAASAFDLAAV